MTTLNEFDLELVEIRRLFKVISFTLNVKKASDAMSNVDNSTYSKNL